MQHSLSGFFKSLLNQVPTNQPNAMLSQNNWTVNLLDRIKMNASIANRNDWKNTGENVMNGVSKSTANTPTKSTLQINSPIILATKQIINSTTIASSDVYDKMSPTSTGPQNQVSEWSGEACLTDKLALLHIYCKPKHNFKIPKLSRLKENMISADILRFFCNQALVCREEILCILTWLNNARIHMGQADNIRDDEKWR